MLIRIIAILPFLFTFANADVEFVTPAAGASIVGGGKTLSVTWKESGVQPPISSLTSYTLFLCAGGNDAGSQVSNRHTKF